MGFCYDSRSVLWYPNAFPMGHDVRLLKIERNAVFTLVQQSGLEPSDFDWKTEHIQEPGEYGVVYADASVLLHKPTGFFYKFGVYSDQYSPGHAERIESVELSVQKWDVRIKAVAHWLSALKEEVEAPDLWQELLRERRLYRLASAPQLRNEQFSNDEKALVLKQLHTLREQIVSAHNLQSQQTEVLDRGLNYLGQSLDRFGKKDWLNLAIGTLINIAVAAAFSPTAAKDLLHGFTSAIRPLFDSVLKLLS